VLASIFYCKENDGTIGAALLHQILPETGRQPGPAYFNGQAARTARHLNVRTMLFRNVGNQLETYAVQHTSRRQASTLCGL